MVKRSKTENTNPIFDFCINSNLKKSFHKEQLIECFSFICIGRAIEVLCTFIVGIVVTFKMFFQFKYIREPIIDATQTLVKRI